MSWIDDVDAGQMRSDVSGVLWPAWPHAFDSRVLALVDQFERTERWPAERLLVHQLRQLQRLVDHAARDVPYYAGRLDAVAGLSSGSLTVDAFRRVPLLSRQDLQTEGSSLYSRTPPKTHGPVYEVTTSGSTGRPVSVLGTDVTSAFNGATNLRYHLWHRRDVNAKFASIRAVPTGTADPPRGSVADFWAPVFGMGPSAVLDASSAVSDQIEWLRYVRPAYLLTYPSNLRELARRCRDSNIRIPGLRQVLTFGECLPEDVRRICDDAWQVPLTDIYSAQEIGSIAVQCPDHPHYHVQSEDVLVEILDDDDAPVEPGEIGRVVVTTLHNFASPLIRYDIGDYAELGPPCPCGRGLPVLNRVIGRARNMLTLPSGERLWPRFNSDDLARVAPIRQFQLVQKSVTEIEAVIAALRPLNADDEARLRAAMLQRLRYDFDISFRYVEEIARSPGGKYEDFRSEIPD